MVRLQQSLAARAVNKCQADFIAANVDGILIGSPLELEDLYKEYVSYCRRNRCKNFKKGLLSVFGYHRFSAKATRPYNAYDLAVRLDVKVCPYCNRQHTFTVVTTGENIIRPEFDHFLSK